MTRLVHSITTFSHGSLRGVAEIVLDSPRNRNALSRQLVDELGECLRAAGGDPAVRAVLLRSAGPSFCSGADLAEARKYGMQQASRGLVALLRQIVALPKPVVAQIDGPVRAGGLGIIGACDVVVASRDATYAFSEALLGLAPAVISLTVLPKMTRRMAALNILSAAVFDGPMAEQSGLVTMAIDASEVNEAVRGVLQDMLKADPQGLQASKALLSAPLLRKIDDLGEDMAELSAELFSTDAAKTAMSAFLKDTKVPD